jgi:hypothetical protein
MSRMRLVKKEKGHRPLFNTGKAKKLVAVDTANPPSTVVGS